MSNPLIAWEETRKLEGSLDLGILKDRLLLNVTYYKNRSSNQLTNLTIPITTGFSVIASNFPALIQNTGWEFQLSVANVGSKIFNWSSSINMTVARNKLVDFPNIEQTAFKYVLEVGQPLMIQKVFHLVGINDSTGLYEFLNNKGERTSTPEQLVDNKAIINMLPRYYGGFSNTFKYKNFELNVLLQFVKQIGLSPLFQSAFAPGMFGTNNQTEEQLKRRERDGVSSDIQKLTSSYTAAYNTYYLAKQSDAAYTNASFVRLKNVTFSYSLPNSLLRKLKLQGVRFNASGQNLLTVTKYKGIDPENANERCSPPLRVITAGIVLSL